MNENLSKNNYLIIPNFISSYKANKLSEEFKEYCNTNNIGGDGQSPLSQSLYNYISFLEILCEKTPEVSDILEETVLPTYTYSRMYKRGSILTPHTDRDACEISLTLHLGSDKSWPIWIKTPEGENRCVNLNPGDAMLYLGKIAEHWRDEYEGEWYTQVFLHYVRSRGNCSYAYFDRERNDFSELEQINITSEKNYHNSSDEKFEKDCSNSSDENNKNLILDPIRSSSSLYKINSTSKLEDFIQVFDDILLEKHCNAIIKEYELSDEWQSLGTGTYNIKNTQARTCTGIPISHEVIIDKNYEIRKRIDEILFVSTQKVIEKYKEIFSSFKMEIDTGYEMLRYEKGQYYIQHTDSFKEQQRSLSCSIQLNDDYIGGEFAFFDREILIRTKPGSVIVFPSNFMYPHEIMPVIEGTRYSIITWLI
jgi:hypothetical protein